MKKITFLLIFIGFGLQSFGQMLSATLVDAESNKPIPFASIAINLPADSSLIAGKISDETGYFEIELENSEYIIEITSVGYEKYSIKSTPRALQTIALKADTKVLEDVVIADKKDAIRFEVDRKILNAESFPQAEVALDLIENLPSIKVDLEGNITYRNDGQFTIFINGRPAVGGEQRLRSIPASSIDRVEMITNPGSKYDAEGSAGIINIVMKKRRLEGISVNAEARFNSMGTTTGSIYFDKEEKKYGWTINGYLGKNIYNNGEMEQRNEIFTAEENFMMQTKVRQTGHYQNNYLQYDFYLKPGEKNRITLSGNFNPFYFGGESEAKGQLDEWNEGIKTSRNSTTTYDYQYRSIQGSLAFEQTFDEEDKHKLTTNIDYEFFSPGTDNEIFLLDSPGKSEKRHAQTVEKGERMVRLKLDYVRPLGEKFNINGGADINTHYFEEVSILNQFWINDEPLAIPNEKTNQRLKDYQQDVYAPYISLKGEWSKLQIQAGLRYEYTLRKSDLSFTNSKQEKVQQLYDDKFGNLFPSLHLLYPITESQQLSFGYSTRIRRPWY